MPGTHMFEWYDVPAVAVYLTWWFGVGALLLALLGLLSVAFRSKRLQDRVCAGAAMCFIAIEAAVLTNLYLKANTPSWFEHLFVFNGFALPAQLVLVIGAFVASDRRRSGWLLAGMLPGLASIPFFTAAAKVAFGVTDA